MMTDIIVKQMPAFKKVYKKLYGQDKIKVNEAIKAIIHDPKIGQEKKGDLSDIFVYKFKIKYREILLAYEWDTKQRVLLAMGVHENFYRDLKKRR
ncbi:MAG: type II toxin-antitoxin system RelE/ParE family toxin [Pseudomonadota bacterium]